MMIFNLMPHNNALLPDPNPQAALSARRRRDCPTHIRTFATLSLETLISWLA
jgi:hypothetical protein